MAKKSKKEQIKLREQIFDKTIARWLHVERETIDSCNELLDNKPPFLVRQMMLLIKRDSEKHEEILSTIQQIQSGAMVITPEEVGDVSELLERHTRIENESLVLARTAIENTKHFVIRQLLGYMLEDERKHVTLSETMEENKKKIYSS